MQSGFISYFRPELVFERQMRFNFIRKKFWRYIKQKFNKWILSLRLRKMKRQMRWFLLQKKHISAKKLLQSMCSLNICLMLRNDLLTWLLPDYLESTVLTLQRVLLLFWSSLPRMSGGLTVRYHTSKNVYKPALPTTQI